MELLNHFVAARLMKDAQLFERIGRHGAAQPRLARPVDSVTPDLASDRPESAAAEDVRPVRDGHRVVSPTECPQGSRYP